jgi:hypothetical protein
MLTRIFLFQEIYQSNLDIWPIYSLLIVIKISEVNYATDISSVEFKENQKMWVSFSYGNTGRT